MTSSRHQIKDCDAGEPNITIRFSWLLPFSRFCTHYLDMKQVSHLRQTRSASRRSEGNGGELQFAIAQAVSLPVPSSGTVYRIHPYYGVYFTWLPSSQLELFLSHNSLYTIFKVLPILGFCFATDVRILASHSYALKLLYNGSNH